LLSLANLITHLIIRISKYHPVDRKSETKEGFLIECALYKLEEKTMMTILNEQHRCFIPGDLADQNQAPFE
jgi:hypothetical protein